MAPNITTETTSNPAEISIVYTIGNDYERSFTLIKANSQLKTPAVLAMAQYKPEEGIHPEHFGMISVEEARILRNFLNSEEVSALLDE